MAYYHEIADKLINLTLFGFSEQMFLKFMFPAKCNYC
jgi:hypothetical protein